MTDEVTDEEGFDYLETGDNLWERLTDLESKFGMGIWFDEGCVWGFLHSGKINLLKRINSDLKIINDRLKYFRNTPDYTHVEDMELQTEEMEIKKRQISLVSKSPGKSYAEIQAEALQSYQQLKEDYLKFKEDVKNTPDKEFGIQVIY